MGISSLGAGSSILTQNVLDQLKAADTAQYVAPTDTKIKEQNTKGTALGNISALMENVHQSLTSLTGYGLFESRTANVSGTAVEVSAASSSDIQDFSLEVTQLATKQIEQSGAFTSKTVAVATGSGQMKLNIGTSPFTIAYDANTTLEGLKDLINKSAGSKVSATIVQMGSADFRLLLSAKETGLGQAISITDVVGAGEKLSTQLTSGITNVQTAMNAKFTFNTLPIERTSNSVNDLLSGVTITLKGVGTSDVSVKQDRENISKQIGNFVDKYNSAMYQLDTDTKSSKVAAERGIFSSDSTIKSMRGELKNMFSTLGEGVGKIEDYGISFDKDGRLALDSTVLNGKLDSNPANVRAFFAGGTFTKSDGTSTALKGSFVEINDEVAKYTNYNAILGQMKTSISDRVTALEAQKTSANDKLTVKYATLAKKFAAYDSMISKLNNASSMFKQMTTTSSSGN